MKRILGSIVLVAVVSLFVAGCSSTPPEEQPKPKGEMPNSTDLTKSGNLTPEQQELAKSRGASGETGAGGDNKETEGAGK